MTTKIEHFVFTGIGALVNLPLHQINPFMSKKSQNVSPYKNSQDN